MIKDEFENSKLNLGSSINNRIKKTIEYILDNEYKNLNEDINSMVEEIDISFNLDIKQPMIEEVDGHAYKRQINQIKLRYEECLSEIEDFKNEIESNYNKKEENEKLIEELNEAISFHKKELNIIGEYIPEYEEVVNNSSSDSCAKVEGL